MKFAFIAKHRGIWPTGWLCGALGVSRGGVYAWLTRPPSARTTANEALLVKVRASFLASDRTYGARRVWHDLLADGIACGFHRIERLMHHQALRARPTARAPRPRPTGSITSSVSTIPSGGTRRWALSVRWSSKCRQDELKLVSIKPGAAQRG